MKTLHFALIFAALLVAVGCKRGNNEVGNAHKLSDEIVLDSISVDDFKSLMDKAISQNDTADIQKLLGLAQSTYQKMAIKNSAEADAFAQQVNAYLLNEPFLDNLITNKDNFFFKFNNEAYEEDEPRDYTEEDTTRRRSEEVDDEVILVEEVNEIPSETPASQSPVPEAPKKTDDKKSGSTGSVPPLPKDRVKNSFDRPTE
ncbi:MAG: hypothetical protein Q4B68_03280 [Bacteroidales bacterium]|nr:hypothetical protein [Bacteroidales bacterium]